MANEKVRIISFCAVHLFLFFCLVIRVHKVSCNQLAFAGAAAFKTLSYPLSASA